MIPNLGQIRQQGAQNCGIMTFSGSTAGSYDFGPDTFPTIQMANMYINDCYREQFSSRDLLHNEKSEAYWFNRACSGVQALFAQGYNASGVSTSGIICPYPPQTLNYVYSSNYTLQDINSNFSGISFNGVDISGNTWPSVSVTGTPTTAIYTGCGVGPYYMNPDVGKIDTILISQSIGSGSTNGIPNLGQSAQGVPLRHVKWHDLEMLIPIMPVTSSGTPYMYSEFPGMGPNQQKVIQFFPSPGPEYQYQWFNVHYQQKHVDLVNDTDTAVVAMEDFNEVILYAFCEKVFEINDNGPKAAIMRDKKEDLMEKIFLWDANNPDQITNWQDMNYRTNAGGSQSTRSPYDTAQTWYMP